MVSNDLFWALRGGGAGPWGVVTAMTIKMHKNPYDCQENCYKVTNAYWRGFFSEDGGAMVGSFVSEFLSWAGSHHASRNWSGYFSVSVTAGTIVFSGFTIVSSRISHLL